MVTIADVSDGLGVLTQVLSAFKQVASKVFRDQVFVKTQATIASYEKLEANDKEFQEKLTAAFDDKAIREIEKNAEKAGITEFREAVWEKLSSVCASYEISEEDTDRICSSYWNVFLSELKKNDLNLYDQLKQFSLIQDIDTQVRQTADLQNQLIVSVDDGLEQLDDIHDLLLPHTQALSEVEHYLKNCTDISTGLDFFDYKDAKFDEAMKEALDKASSYIRVSGSSAEEIGYVTLSFIKRYSPEDIDRTRLVRSRDDWEKLEGHLRNSILIPCFSFAGQGDTKDIRLISDNINIIPVTRGNSQADISVRPRISSNTEEALKNIGYSLDKAYSLANKAHGNFSIIKRALFKGSFEPAWVQKIQDSHYRNEVLIPVLLLNQWKDTDSAEVSDFAGKNYDDFLSDVHDLLTGDDPFLYKVIAFGGDYYQVLDPVMAWEYLDDFVIDKEWEHFGKKAVDLLKFRSGIFQYPVEQRTFKQPFIQEGNSIILRKGLLRTMIIRRNRDKDRFQPKIDSGLSEVFDDLKDSRDWESFSEICTFVAEAAPAVFIKHIYKELSDKDSPFLTTYRNDKGDVYFKPTYYTQYLFAIEEVLCFRESVGQAVRCLMLLNEWEVKHTFSNSAADTLYKVFVSWHRESALHTDELICLAEEYVNKFAKGWDIIERCIMSSSGGAVSQITRPVFQADEVDDHELSQEEVLEIDKTYVKLVVQRAELDAKRWSEMLKKGVIFRYGMEDEALERLKTAIPQMSESDRVFLKDTLRHEIYRHRYFADSVWAITANQVKKLADLFQAVQLDEPERDYIYAFRSRIYVLNPKPHTEKEDWKIRAETDQEYRIKLLQEYREKGFSLAKLLQYSQEYGDFEIEVNIGRVAAIVYADNYFDKNLFEKLFSASKQKSSQRNIAWDAYLRQILYSGQNKAEAEYLKAVDYLKEKHEEGSLTDEEFVQALLLQTVDLTKKEPLIDTQIEDIQHLFWQKMSLRLAENRESVYWAVRNYLKREFLPGVVQSLCLYHSMFSGEEMLDIMVDAINRCKDRVDKGDYPSNALQELHTEIDSVIENIQKQLKGKYGCYDRLASVEYYFHNWIYDSNEFIALKYRMGHDPAYAASYFLPITLKDDMSADSGVPEQHSGDETSGADDYMFFFYQFRFFPDVDSFGAFNPDALESWVQEFENIMTAANRKNACHRLLGMIFAHSPEGADGCFPHESVRESIENRYDEHLNNSYIAEVFNMRGAYVINDGTAELKLSEQYHDTADALRIRYPVTASIYDELEREYRYEAEKYRERAVAGV